MPEGRRLITNRREYIYNNTNNNRNKNNKEIYSRNTAHVIFKNRSNPGNNRGNWNDLEITSTSNMPVEHEIKELQEEPYWAQHTYCGQCKWDGKVKNLQHSK